MQNTLQSSTPARTRTWKVVIHHRPYGEYWGSSTHLITMTRDSSAPGGFRAVNDGQNADVRRAGQLLHAASLKPEVLHEELMEEVAA